MHVRLKILASLILLAALAVLAALLYLKKEQPRRPTITGWISAVTTLAGDGAPGNEEGSRNQARFRDPFGIVIDRKGAIYVSDAGENNRIRKITKEGIVSTLAGAVEGYADGQGTAASFNSPSGLAIDSAGNIYVADTANNRIRKITPGGLVTTLAGDGVAGYKDGPASSSEFNGPIGVAVDAKGIVYVADTYNDCIRSITPEGTVNTLAGARRPGYQDGDALTAAMFDTPCELAVAPNNELLIADTGNNQIRKLTSDGQVLTIRVFSDGVVTGSWAGPIGIAITHDNFLYVTESSGGRVMQVSPDGRAHIIAGRGSGYSDGNGRDQARFNHPAGIAIDPAGNLVVADSANYLVRKLNGDGTTTTQASRGDRGVLPRLSPDLLGTLSLPWPVDPQRESHEVVATMGEVRGNFTGESRDHLHSGIDIQAPYGGLVKAIYDEKVSSSIANWGFGGLNEGMHVGFFSYIHMRVGRDVKDRSLKSPNFLPVTDDRGQIIRCRVKRGTRFHVGDALGTVNKMYHVHLNFGPSGAEFNPLALPFIGFGDHVAPTIERGGVNIFSSPGVPLTEKRNGRLVLSGNVRIVVDAYDKVDGDSPRRRLGLHRLGYQLLKTDGTAAPGFEQPRITILFDRLPADSDAVKIAYAEQSGITVYGSAATRFLYEVTNTVRDGEAVRGNLSTSDVPRGDYVLRIIASDLAGNEAVANRDVQVRIE